MGVYRDVHTMYDVQRRGGGVLYSRYQCYVQFKGVRDWW